MGRSAEGHGGAGDFQQFLGDVGLGATCCIRGVRCLDQLLGNCRWRSSWPPCGRYARWPFASRRSWGHPRKCQEVKARSPIHHGRGVRLETEINALRFSRRIGRGVRRASARRLSGRAHTAANALHIWPLREGVRRNAYRPHSRRSGVRPSVKVSPMVRTLEIAWHSA